jgi:hypothetical protein
MSTDQTTTDLGVVTELDVVRIADLLQLVGRRIQYLDDADEIVGGTLRGLRCDNGSDGYPRRGQDIRTTWMRITTQSGFERWEPTVQLATKFAEGCAALA